MKSYSARREAKTLPTALGRGKKGNLKGNNEQVLGKQEKHSAKFEIAYYRAATSEPFADNNNEHIV